MKKKRPVTVPKNMTSVAIRHSNKSMKVRGATRAAVQAFRFSEIRAGETKSRRYTLTKDIYGHFLEAFQDTNPVHVDDVFAKKKGFKSKIMHGAILNGFVSHFIGVYFPGKYALLRSVNMQYRSPVYLGDDQRLRCAVEHKSEGTKTLSLALSCFRENTKTIVATAKIQIGLTA